MHKMDIDSARILLIYSLNEKFFIYSSQSSFFEKIFRTKKKAKMANIEETLEKMWKCEQIKPEDFKPIYIKGKEILSKEENVVKVSLPVTVCGDIHGQFPDLMELFKVGGRVPETNYLFMGDFVDRGVNGVEVMMLLIGLKVK